MEVRPCQCGDHAFANTSTNAGVILVSPQDTAIIATQYWTAQKRRKTFYAKRVIDGRFTSLHKLLTGERTDHINRNGLDNRRPNLRPADPSINGQNRAPSKHSSIFLGVFRERDHWLAGIVKNYKFKRIGMFSVEEDAAHAYDKAALELYGPFAFVNFK